MRKGLFISATSTEIGKTVVSAILVKKLLDEGNKVCYYKPVQTGAIYDNNKLISTDIRFVESVCKNENNLSTYSTYLYKKPASPHFSSGLENQNIELNKILSDFKRLSNENDIILIEGAGGLYVPLNKNNDLVADIIEKTNSSLVLVANAGLGTINHTCLSVYFAKQKNIFVSSIILLYFQNEPSDIEVENKNILKKILNIDEIYLLPAVKNVNTELNILGDISEKMKYFPGSNKIKEWINE